MEPDTEIVQAIADNRTRASLLSALIERPEFRWFMEECVKNAITKTESEILNTETTDDETRILKHFRRKLLDIEAWPVEQLRLAKNFLQEHPPTTQ